MMFKPLDFHALRVPFRIVVCSKVKVLLRYQEADNSEFTTLVRTRRASVTKWRVFHQDDQGGKKDPDLQISSDLNIMDSNFNRISPDFCSDSSPESKIHDQS